MKNRHLLICLVLVLVAGTARRSQPKRDTLAAILDAFAWNLEHDGKLPTPRLTSISDVGYVFDDFGRRSALGISYKKQFAVEFEALGNDLAAAASAGMEAGAEQLTKELRAEFVAIFRHHRELLK